MAPNFRSRVDSRLAGYGFLLLMAPKCCCKSTSRPRAVFSLYGICRVRRRFDGYIHWSTWAKKSYPHRRWKLHWTPSFRYGQLSLSGATRTDKPCVGKIENVGADWGLTDPRTNIFSADTRYNLRTDDGADIFIQTAGPKAPDGHLHLRLIFETGSPKYYWLNNVLGELNF